jgi:hypothetical protein
MAKTLSESAAEILKASLNSRKQDPMQPNGEPVNDLGGATPTDDYAEAGQSGDGGKDPSVGKQTAAAVKKSPVPGGRTDAQEKPAGKSATPPALKKATTSGFGDSVEHSEDEYVISEDEEVEQMDEASKSMFYSPEEVKAAQDHWKKNVKPVYKEHGLSPKFASAVNAHVKEHGSREVQQNHGGADGNHPKWFNTNTNKVRPLVKNTGYTIKESWIVDKEVESDDFSEEDILEAKKEMMKEMVRKHKGTMKEDVDALFNGESLSEDFRVKATLIFESAVQSRVERIVEDVLADNDTVLEEAYSSLKTELSEQVDTYLNYVVEEWMTDNQVAVETGLRAELSEEFISGLKTLFTEHYIEIPDEKLDVAEELAVRVVELEESFEAAKVEFDAVRAELNESKKNEAVRKACNGLTETQIAKLKSLAEGVEFTTEGDFDNKLATIRENYFPSKKIVSEVRAIQETSTDQPEVAQVSGIMENYVRSITKSLPK